ncbi:spore coat protein [Paludifilum halophilum]|uniref:Coat protein F n=1 Tax=Paludifilum halophilum TaxID=1642702 RepID=A0A235BBV2_9BACL|nr:spore coat protein [Paludifilum halophilum]OYD09499.1 coat protein F [Paludifilum halophilum]
MSPQLGAHEVMEIHEVLSDTVDGINQFELYRPHVQDPQLANILDHQIQFMNQEYNQMVQALGQMAPLQGRPSKAFQSSQRSAPVYGVDNPGTTAPNPSGQQLSDRDIASGMLGCAKSSANLRMLASLECADPQIRRMLTQGAVNCGDQAYETFQYMNQRGYYQVPTMPQNTANAMLGMYQPASPDNQVPMQ